MEPMKAFRMMAAGTALALCTMAAPAFAQEAVNAEAFVKMCDGDKDGMVSKAEAMKMIEKMFDKQDTKKMGKLDKKQVEAFLREVMKSGG
jgi:hypothetical protein